MILLWDVYGWGVVVIYVITILFAFFGLFNLIMALFVEKTLAGAETITTKRFDGQYWEHVGVARKLQEVVMKLCQGKQLKAQPTLKERRISQVRGIINFWPCGKVSQRQDCTEEHKAAKVDYANLQVHINRKDFEAVVRNEEVSGLLDSLEVSVTSAAKLFDILDCNGSGWVDIAEMAEGLVKMRGPVDKGDIVSTVLMVRHVQKTLHEIQRDQEKLKEIVMPLQNVTKNRVYQSRRSGQI